MKQVQFPEEPQYFTPQICSNGQVDNHPYFLNLPFGLKNAPDIFQRILDDILWDYIGRCWYVYIDDIILFSKSGADHEADLGNIFRTRQQANMKVDQKKCKFLKKEVKFLGFIVKPDGIKTNPSIIEAIQIFSTSQNFKELRSFLFLSGYYRRFFKDYAKFAKPLIHLLRGEDGRASKNQLAKKQISLDEEAINALKKQKCPYFWRRHADLSQFK